jgi:uncharacterized damage-inducible protein DinB
MAIKDALLPEFDHEMGSTRRLLERVPDSDLKWTPHEKSFNMGSLAAHIANIPTWVHAISDTAIFDVSTIGEDARPKEPVSTAELLQRFDDNVRGARGRIAEQTDGALMAMWTFKQGEHEVFSMPKIAVLRGFIMNHIIHHRGQLTVYLRLRDVPLPSIYGPTADES